MVAPLKGVPEPRKPPPSPEERERIRADRLARMGAVGRYDRPHIGNGCTPAAIFWLLAFAGAGFIIWEFVL